MRGLPLWLGNSSFTVHPFTGGLILLMIWSLVWTGFALWHAAKRNDKAWFILFLLVHTAGILEIVYLAFVVRIFDTTKKKRRS